MRSNRRAINQLNQIVWARMMRFTHDCARLARPKGKKRVRLGGRIAKIIIDCIENREENASVRG